ncbi:hypothetical protein Q427_24770 [Halomonas sp. BC04]|nr:hypothetical protein Q427_24770 [Halomonas sp. BC04]
MAIEPLWVASAHQRAVELIERSLFIRWYLRKVHLSHDMDQRGLGKAHRSRHRVFQCVAILHLI